MKLQGLRFLENQFSFQGDMMLHVLLYKNTDPDKRATHTLGMAKWVLCAKECADVSHGLGLMREVCELALAGTVPDYHDPYYDLINDEELTEPRAYDPYEELRYYLHPDNTPHGLGLDLSPELLLAAEILLAGPRTLRQKEAEVGQRLMRRNEGDPTGPFRPMTDGELAKHTRRQETEFMEATLFTVDFNHDMARLRDLVLQRGDLAEILALIGPVPEPELEEAPEF